MKTDSDGIELWSQTFGDAGHEYSSAIQQTVDGGYIMAGSTNSFGAGDMDVYFIKTDSRGNELWSQTVGGVNKDVGRNSVEQTPDGGYVTVGSTYSFGHGGEDVYLVKLTASGEPYPDIKANNFDGPVTISQGDNLKITVALTSNEYDGDKADWWIKADSPLGFYWYKHPKQWIQSLTPIRAYGGSLFNLSPCSILNISTLPVGPYDFEFSVDDNQDGQFDGTFSDSVLVTIE